MKAVYSPAPNSASEGTSSSIENTDGLASAEPQLRLADLVYAPFSS
jgi:hypothetical protein